VAELTSRYDDFGPHVEISRIFFPGKEVWNFDVMLFIGGLGLIIVIDTISWAVRNLIGIYCCMQQGWCKQGLEWPSISYVNWFIVLHTSRLDVLPKT
jgi:hypothetical protein